MEKINSQSGLKAAILLLEEKQDDEGKQLRLQYLQAYESMKPINLVKSTFREVTASAGLSKEIINTSVGLAAGYVSKIMFQGVSHSAVRKLLGTVLMFGVTNVVAKHPEVIKSVGIGFLKMITGKRGQVVNRKT